MAQPEFSELRLGSLQASGGLGGRQPRRLRDVSHSPTVEISRAEQLDIDHRLVFFEQPQNPLHFTRHFLVQEFDLGIVLRSCVEMVQRLKQPLELTSSAEFIHSQMAQRPR